MLGWSEMTLRRNLENQLLEVWEETQVSSNSLWESTAKCGKLTASERDCDGACRQARCWKTQGPSWIVTSQEEDSPETTRTLKSKKRGWYLVSMHNITKQHLCNWPPYITETSWRQKMAGESLAKKTKLGSTTDWEYMWACGLMCGCAKWKV